ncbi:MAG: flagellar protein FliS [Lachnospiraceae bacterium]
MTDELKKEFTLRITQANPISMITILYEITLTYLEEAAEAKQSDDREKFVLAIHHGQDCIRELQSSLNLSYEPAPALYRLYIQMHRKLAQAITGFSLNACEKVQSQLEQLRDAYIQLEKTGSWDSVMVNTQQVYAGLTYGRTSLVESLEQGDNRGFLA